MKNFIDLRSDTVTKQPEFMKEAMFKAEVGDDVYGDDPTIIKLENLAAEIIGKEAALFVPSGTFGNQLALFTHCKRGSEVILADSNHIIAHEVGASSIIAGVQLRSIDSNNGVIKPNEIEKRIRFEDEDIHFPSTSLICVENAHSSGNVLSLGEMDEIYTVAKKYNLPVHLDGARVFNASASLNVDVKEITKYCDSIMFCLSKGLCAPVGSVLAGSKEFIAKARKKRKLMGGGLRQAGFLAAAGIVALNDMTKRLNEDHENAKLLASELNKLPEINVNLDNVKINMVFFSFKDNSIDTKNLVKFFLENNIKINDAENGLMRFVTHYWVTKDDIYKIVSVLKSFLYEQ
ncbi:low-specificity L-threonine aldolase [Clostridium sp. C8]|uniref:low-specificity L-threonine aldolase n=1 Tax=Clostridium sp. C8 TaxID=1667357 RepID=UPI000A07C73B|nr:low-specificity L-threonine aldolase [Clostridium sp. C8]